MSIRWRRQHERRWSFCGAQEQNLDTMNGARTIAFDSKTNHLFTMSQERGPAPPPPPGGGRGPQGTPVPGSFAILMIGK